MPELCRMSRASRRSAHVRMSDVFVSCAIMKRITPNGASRSRNRGWKGEKEAPGCQRCPAKDCPCQSGIQTRKLRTGSDGVVSSIRR